MLYLGGVGYTDTLAVVGEECTQGSARFVRWRGHGIVRAGLWRSCALFASAGVQ